MVRAEGRGTVAKDFSELNRCSRECFEYSVQRRGTCVLCLEEPKCLGFRLAAIRTIISLQEIPRVGCCVLYARIKPLNPNLLGSPGSNPNGS